MANKQFPLSVVIQAIDRVTTPIGKIQRGILGFDQRLRAKLQGVGGRLAAASDRLGLPVLAAAAGRAGGALGELGRRISIVGGGIAAMVGAAASAGFGIVTSFADAAGQINDVATSIGISAEALQEWRYAAKQNGVEAELLDRSMQLLARNFGDARAGKGEAKDVLEALGINVKKVKDVEQLMPLLADKIAKIENPMVRASVAAKLFGRSGVQLIPMLKDGSKGLSEYAAAARRLGVVISNEAIAQADDFGDKFDDLKLSLTGVRNIIGTQLMPVITDLVQQLTDFVVSHGPQIKAFFQDFAAKLPGRLVKLREAFFQVRDAVQPVVKAFEWLADKFGAGNVAVAAVATALVLYLVPAVYSAATAFYALGVAILTTPVGWILAAIALIAGAVYLIYKNWEPIKQFFADWWESTKAVWGTVADFFLGIWNDVKEGFEGGFLNGMINLFETLNPVNLIIKAFKELLPRMKEAVAPFLGWFKDGFMGALVPDFARKWWGLDDPNLKTPAQRRAAPVGAANVARNAAAAQGGEARVRVDFNNLPKGARVTTETKGRPAFELNQGFAMGSTR